MIFQETIFGWTKPF